ncbi:SRPBCC family protein [Bryobacter aggregatus]|uniref:SRPBCC family protein n=1 Tax=Bryobacter aggregatus TaxID=360054 RepID=UPI000689CAE2|nr:SRPBCC domain-containing protein [Bryobacter aggregatus]
MSRTLMQEIDIDASPKQVWSAITEGEKIEGWFTPHAKVVPGKGGSVVLGYGPGMEAQSVIHLWKPEEKFGVTESGAAPKVIEFEIEGQGGRSRLRVVQSGFGDGAAFDQEYEATSGGWQTYLRVLKFGLENHPSEVALQASTFRIIETTREVLERRISELFLIQPSLEELPVGASYTAQLGAMGKISGVRLEPDKKGYCLLTVHEWDGSLLAFFSEQMASQCYLTFQAYLFGAARERAEELKSIFAAFAI